MGEARHRLVAAGNYGTPFGWTKWPMRMADPALVVGKFDLSQWLNEMIKPSW